MKKNILLLFLLISRIALGQSIDIYYCYKKAEENYPLFKQKSLYSQAAELKSRSLNTEYLPQVNLNAQATYQSDVTKIPLKIPGINIVEPTKDNYKASIDINQLIWDAGTIEYRKELENLNFNNEIQNIEVEINKVKERINQLYFNVLTFNKTLELLESNKYDIQLKLKKIETSVKYGFLNESSADNLKAEIAKIDQKIIEINSQQNSAILMLSEICGDQFSQNANFKIPELPLSSLIFENNRPELITFDINNKKLSVQQKIITSKLYPKVYAFGQIGYGRPGLNMLSVDFQSYYLVGAKLSWNIWDWNQTDKEKKIIDLQKNILSFYKETFDKNTKVSWYKDKSEIEKYEALLLKDNEIMVLKSKIARTASSQFDSGYITSSDYLNEVNAELQAKINYEIHKILLVKAKFDYLLNIGKL
jgi:outer membrane protein TolC